MEKACGRAARSHNVTVAIGINEVNSQASGTSLYNTLPWIGPDGAILDCRRKLVPAPPESV